MIKDWLLVDEDALRVKKMVYRLPNDGKSQAELIAGAGNLEGVRQILETGSDRELIVVALVMDEDSAKVLREQLEALAPGRSVRMDVVEYEDHRPSVDTWRALAQVG